MSMYYVQLYSNSKHKMKMGAGILTIPPFRLILMMNLYQNTLIRLRLTKFTTISLCLSHIHMLSASNKMPAQCHRHCAGPVLSSFFIFTLLGTFCFRDVLRYIYFNANAMIAFHKKLMCEH